MKKIKVIMAEFLTILIICAPLVYITDMMYS